MQLLDLSQHREVYEVNERAQIIPVIEYEDESDLIHTTVHEHCDDVTCPCNANVISSTATVR